MSPLRKKPFFLQTQAKNHAGYLFLSVQRLSERVLFQKLLRIRTCNRPYGAKRTGLPSLYSQLIAPDFTTEEKNTALKQSVEKIVYKKEENQIQIYYHTQMPFG